MAFLMPGIFLLISFSLIVTAEVCKESDHQAITECTRCIWRTDCIWCMDPDKPGSGLVTGCVKKNTACKSPLKAPTSVTNTKAESLSKHSDENIDLLRSVQISPQEIILVANPAESIELQFEVALSENPVDIYFVMDLSNSMSVQKENLVKAADAIAEQIKRLTPDYQLGFGSFSDKPTAPFAAEVHTYTEKKPPYAFRHELKLTKDLNLFKNNVKNSELTGNVDNPEAGFDALVQSITCGDLIGWRENVRRVIIFVTDQEPHIALDGLLGGIVMPNDGVCQTRQTSNGKVEYVEQLTRDYPSFSQLRELMSSNQMPVIIFAVNKSMTILYGEISKFIQSTVNVGELTPNPNSLKDIVTKQYEAIKNRLAVRSTYDQSLVEVLPLESNCANSSMQDNLAICNGVTVGEVLTYKTQVKPKEKECIARYGTKDLLTEMIFELDGFAKDTLKVKVQCVECSCGEPVPNALQCNNQGTLRCGGCDCNNGFKGKSCECDLTKSGGTLFRDCKPANSSVEECNNRGDCVCGHCENCIDGYLGQYCECHRDDCPGKSCSGHGTCLCEKGVTSCSCEEGFTGPDCSCPTSTDNCEDKLTKRVCSGSGTCNCGKCECGGDNHGKYCQRSTSLDTCSKLAPCVKHSQFKENVSDSTLQEWESGCKKNTEWNEKKLFGEKILVACQRSTKSENQVVDIELLYHNTPKSCPDVIEESANIANNSVNVDNLEHTSETVHILKTDPEKSVRCELEYEGCKVVFYHERLEDDQFFGEGRDGRVFIVHHNDSDDGSWTPLGHCAVIPMAIVLGSTMGILFLICLVAFIVILVLINIRDRQSWIRYLQLRAENEARLGQFQNPLYQEQAQTTVQNPAFGRASK